MKVIKAIDISDSVLKESNVPYDDTPQWSMSGVYKIGDKVVYGRHEYVAVKDVETAQLTPDIDRINWLDNGAINRYRMFDNVISNPTVNDTDINLVFEPKVSISAIVFLDVFCSEITVRVLDPLQGVIYEKTQYGADLPDIKSFYDYHNAPVSENKKVISFVDLPDLSTATIEVSIRNYERTVSCGELLMGVSREIGKCNYGTVIGLRSFSRKETDEFGRVTVVKRKNSKYAEYDIDIETKNLASVQRFFSDIDSVPCIFVGNETMEELLVYGFYSDFQATIAFPQISKCTLRVEGLI